jgi:hypothetical protein
MDDASEQKKAPTEESASARRLYLIDDAAQDQIFHDIAIEHEDEIATHAFEIKREIDEINADESSRRSVLVETPLSRWWQRKRKVAQS